MKRNENRYRKIRLLPGALLYPVLLVFSIIFTQLLRNAISAALLWFVICLPVFSLIYTLIGKASIQVYVMSDVTKAEKTAPVEYEIRIINTSFLPFPFVDTVLSEPGTDTNGCRSRKFVLSLISFGSYIVKNKVRFKYRGLYEIGVESLYISDMLRFFALRVDVGNYTAVSVYPRKLSVVSDRAPAITDIPSPNVKRTVTEEKNELSDIRDYAAGDSVRDIHWKLSSKTQDLKVKQYNSAEDRHIYILCDLAKAAVPPKKNMSDVYLNLKNMMSAKNDKNKKLKRAIYEYSVSRDNDKNEGGNQQTEAFDLTVKKEKKKDKKKFFAKFADFLKKKKKEHKFKKNKKSGMTEKQAQTVRAIDELIESSKKKNLRNAAPVTSDITAESAQPAERKKTKSEMALEELESDIRRIISDVDFSENGSEGDKEGKAFGGRVKEEFESDHDELCADAVVEIALSVAGYEIKRGNTCTVAWYDSREESGVGVYTVSDVAEFDEIFSKLSTAGSVPSEYRVSHLSAVISENTNVTLRVITSNIDPVSVDDIGDIPSKFGGAGTGCTAEAVIFSPNEKYEDPSERASYTAKTCLDLMRRGIAAYELRESTDGLGNPVFVTAE